MCQRHGCRKTEHWHNLCRKHAGYFRMWEEGRGPGQQVGQPPGWLRRAWNFCRAVVRHVRNWAQYASRRVYRERLAICRACPSLDPERMVCREKTCGCYVERKARWASEECPLGKWRAAGSLDRGPSQQQPGDEPGESTSQLRTLHPQPTTND
ncbi:MAG: hypothetical protein DWQ34_13885 [Planctomycetota bacterium]|nr:MAG: hypothetical protein DWQ34_13885 [Planctomycetota bacterium]REJ94360.1 MAG: hypothetical protein DWQ29_02960 [Planctomycetota bacterium]REK21694.1 MAG: hypothetical protein DWQ41_20710 [Planctomycetota bacterium]REK32745.1 MAG: hypothetical protein DWQ45_16740 [Planctomycetota bacterium]